MTARAVTFDCHGDRLVGVLHESERSARFAVLVVVGGPQYRIGAHRQFLYLARHLAQSSVPVLRFDYRGMGDSQGAQRSFEHIEDDIRSAVDYLTNECNPSGGVVLVGLCDAASAALMYAHTDSRVVGLVAMNPWVRSQSTLAQTTVKRYYLRRVLSAAFWRKLFSGEFDAAAAWSSLRSNLRNLRPRGSAARKPHFVDRMLSGFERFEGKVLVVLSGDDMTALEFDELASGSRAWNACMTKASTSRKDMPDADHTFSTKEWQREVDRTIERWIAAL